MLTDTQIAEAVARYEREHDRYVKLADSVYDRCREIVRMISVRATVQRRAKDPEGLRKKLVLFMKSEEKAKQYNSADDVFARISDLAGVRVTTYMESDRDRVVEEICKAFAGATAESPEVDKKDGRAKGLHYRATHCQVMLRESDLPEGSNLRSTSCEVQVCSLLAHVWNEIEHDLGYKPESGELGRGESQLLDQLGLLTKAGDIAIQQLLEETERRMRDREGEFADIHDFVARMRKDFPDATDFGRYAQQLLEECERLGLNSPEAIRAALYPAGEQSAEAKRILAELKSCLRGTSTTVNEQSSDLLLALLLAAKAGDIANAHEFGPGQGRPTRLVYLARRYASSREDCHDRTDDD